MLSGKLASIFAISCSVAIAGYGSEPIKKTAVVDAGSTGSRLHIYEYSLDPANGIPVIEKKTSSKKKGGIQEEKVDSLDGYLQGLFASVIDENINNIYFYSTAGMRQIRPEKRAVLNDEVEQWLKDNFPSSTIEVETITGKKEGLYAWLALNYDNSRIKLQGDTVGVLDLGGASTQIAYEVDKNEDFTVKISSKTYKLNAESFLGLGLDQAISQYLNRASCFPKGFPLPDGRNGTGDYNTCTRKIEPLITKVQEINHYIEHRPPKNTLSFLATAGFDYTALELGISKDFSIKSLDEKGKAFCDSAWNDLKSGKTSYPVNPFLWHYCFDAAYEKDLLTFGYSLNTKDIPIKTASSIDYKADWSIGVLFNSFVTPVKTEKREYRTGLLKSENCMHNGAASSMSFF
ncbi:MULTISPECIES: hypothetical protein [unclassified Endozoicomonas]|uniref:hypothetical protein n=1 Tax=unclassified Endozoicomonas TaxID=2644528 RepID=UPI0021490B9E|nr:MULTISPECIES: hypothetical protein [unclassified Endozoicomonas]